MLYHKIILSFMHILLNLITRIYH